MTSEESSMWRAGEFQEDLDYVTEQIEDDEAFIEELQNAQAHLRQDKNYLNRRYSGEELQFMGVVTNDRGYVLAHEGQDRGSIDNFYVLTFEKEQNSEKAFLKPKDALRMESFQHSDIPGANSTRTATWDFCYRMLKKTSDEPDQDMMDLNPDYTPAHYR
ncbi:MAG: hypothetical protein SVU32_05865 [Candidatus Nanohaloarchaea archaeon]|nr:hypothetical protein [Candidatus Nanohaloarchaea archaeon]